MSDSTYSGTSKRGAPDEGCHHRDEASRLVQQDDRSSGAERQLLALLARVVQRDIVPNLITANRVIGASLPPAFNPVEDAWHDSGFNTDRGERDMDFATGHVRVVDVARFVRLLRGSGTDAAPALVEVLLSRGISRNELYLDLLAPAARMIGDMWEDDECSFADVTMVVGRLHNILNTLRSAQGAVVAHRFAPSILLTKAPGEQHAFGVAVVDAIFQEAGWRTRLSHTNDADELIDQARGERFDAIGFSLSDPRLADVLRATIVRLRAASANRDIVVMVGGSAFYGDPSLSGHVGADMEVAGGVEAAARARDWLPGRVYAQVPLSSRTG